MRGDPPSFVAIEFETRGSTPHARGSTQTQLGSRSLQQVYPACAGIHPQAYTTLVAFYGLPRMRGDPPGKVYIGQALDMSTPHARGSTLQSLVSSAGHDVYPACAGIHLYRDVVESLAAGLPRMRGDPPPHSVHSQPPLLSTPHARGSTDCGLDFRPRRNVYPACAGIHLTQSEHHPSF